MVREDEEQELYGTTTPGLFTRKELVIKREERGLMNQSEVKIFSLALLLLLNLRESS